MNANSLSMLPQSVKPGEGLPCMGTTAFWRRTAAFLIDLGLLGALHLAFFLTLAFFIFRWTPLDFGLLIGITITYAFFFLGAPFVLFLSYFTILHTWGGQTLGKIIIGLRVTGIDDQPLTTGRAFLRTCGYFASALPLGAGFLWVVLDRDARSWHDRIARSKVAFLNSGRHSRPESSLAVLQEHR